MIVLTAGTFDLFHAGHVALLARCRALAGTGRVIVGLNSDAFVEHYRGRPPVLSYPDREAVLAGCRYVDVVLPNHQADGTMRDLIAIAEPDLIAVGDDWLDRDYLGQIGVTAEELYLERIRIAYLPYTPGAAGSSTAIKRRIAEATA